jgi:cyclophilin family peptidyl-prolyl cis-trans isomerase
MPPADKRARKKENARAAREQREAAAKRKKRTRSAITIGVVGVIFIGVIVLLSVIGGHKKKTASTTTSTTASSASTSTSPAGSVGAADYKLDPGKTYTATISTNFGKIGLALDTKSAPVGAGHFIKLARAGVYNGSRWHRVIKGFVIQGGAPGGDPTKEYGHSVVGELPKGKYGLGDIAAAKTGTDPNGTFDSQFFIVTGPEGEALPAQYADFGTVTSGMDVVRRIEGLPTDSSQDPTTKATIDTVTIAES